MEITRKQKIIIALIATLTLITIITVYALSTVTITNQVHINSIAAQITASTDNFQWGDLNQGEQSTKIVTLTNTGDDSTTTLSYTVEGSLGGTLIWDAVGKTIAGHSSLLVTFTYTAGTTPGDYGFTIYISG